MVSASEGMIYYCTVFLTALVFLTEASAITTNYEKSTAQNKTDEFQEISPHRTKLAPARGRSALSKNQNQDRVNSPLVLGKIKTSQKTEPISETKSEPELLIPKNSGGENDVKDKGGGSTDDDDKTLSEQVADGKYGLIQHEIFTSKPQRPGVISYDINPEVPKDSVNNLGGLEPEDIWLAENHLLVLAGSGFNNGMQTQWKPIDNYIAPKRPVKLSLNSKVPPPFPVQLSENGPIEFLKPANGGGTALSFVPFFNPLSMPAANIGNKTQSFPQPLYGKLPDYAQYGPPGTSQLKPLHFAAQPPVLVKPPPGSEFIPPYLGGNNNNTDAIDEDDPSLYYPPPYDFFYATDNSSKVPPGPLVPGIVLPPPPDFFTLLTNKTAKSQNSPVTKPPRPLYKSTYPYNKSPKQLNYAQFSEGDLSLKVKPVPSTEKPKEQTTFVNYDDIVNEVTYPVAKHDKITYSDIKVNKVGTDEIDDWIPIPAPKPFYITGEKKPSQNTLLVMMDTPYTGRMPKTGYAYDKPGNQLKIVTVDHESTPAPFIEPTTKRTKIKFSNYLDRFPSSDEFHSTTRITPLIPTTVKKPPKTEYYTSTPSPASDVFNTPGGHTAGVDTIKATYYFYEEPEFPKSPAITNTGYTSQAFSTTTPLPIAPINTYNEYSSNTATIKSKVPEKSRLQVVNHESKRKPITPMIPIYYLAELENIVDLVKPMNLPYQSDKNTYYTTTSKPTYSVGKPSYDRPTPRPIFEYSYVASDYNGGPASNQLAQSTPQTYQDPYASPQFNYNPYYHPQQQYQPIYNPLDFSKPIQTTIAPLLNAIFSDKPIFTSNGAQYQQHAHQQSQKANDYDSFDRPWIPNAQYSQFSYPTDNPYYAFFTKEEEDLIDENTKKYFTIFGQKIRNVDSTTPLPVQTASSTTAPRWNSDRDRNRDREKTVKYSKPSTQPSQPITSNYLNRPNNYGLNYYTSTVPYTPEYTTVKSHYQRPSGASNNAAATHPKATGESQKLPVSLEGDTLVNYVTPLTEDPDAEYITPKLSKQHIRPIVVEDLPPDVNERLKNLMNSPKYQDKFKRNKHVVSSSSTNRYRYILVDDQQQQQHQHQHQQLQRDNDKDPYDSFDYQQPYENGQQTHSSTPLSLEGDILVNYQATKLTANPNAEYIDSQSSTQKFRDKEDVDESSQKPKPISLDKDILVNYQNKEQLTINPDAEYIDTNDNDKATTNKAATNVVSYKYPAVEHGHFYFLTPQETHLTQLENESYNFQSDVEKPGGYFKRKPRKDQSIENTTVKTT